MQGIYLKFFVHENHRHQGRLVYEWLIDHAKTLNIHGGSAYRAIAGYGRDSVVHQATFLELQGDLSVEVGFVLDEEKCAHFLALIEREKLSLFYIKHNVEYGTINPTL